jgi:xanthine/uracil permease
MTGRNLDAYLGRAFLGDTLATIVSAFGGGTGVTTYAENIGVMAATRVYSTALFLLWPSCSAFRPSSARWRSLPSAA